MKSKVPLYDTLNVQLRGYDYPVLESYQKFLHTMAKNMDIDVEDCWATPAQELQISTYKPQSEIVANTYLLKKYERTVQITDISAFQVHSQINHFHNVFFIASYNFVVTSIPSNNRS